MTANAPAWLRNWLERHQDPVSRGLHYVGIPLAVLALPLAGVQLAQWRWDLWWRPVALLAVGYFLQYLGHRREGNELGEVVLVKKLLGRPYVAIAPQYARGDTTERSKATAGRAAEMTRNAAAPRARRSDSSA